MSILRLDHINVTASDLDRSRRFYREVMGLEDGARPPFRRSGAWMYLDGHPIIHLSTGRIPATRSSDAFDHVAFRSQGLAALKAKLVENDVHFEEYRVPDQDMHQVFFRDPDGTEIELIFDLAESADPTALEGRDATQGRKT